MPGPRGLLCLMLLIVAVHGKCSLKGNKKKNTTEAALPPLLPLDPEIPLVDTLLEEEFSPTSPLHQNCTTNATVDESRIVGGSTASVAAYTYMVYIKSTLLDGTTTLSCGGALLTDTYAITSAQCVYNAVSISVYVAVTDATGPDSTTTASGLAIIYPSFRRYTLVHDIALVKLFSSFDFSKGTAGPATLPKGSKASFINKLDGMTVRILGYGSTDSTLTDLSTTLQSVEQTQMSRSTCDNKMLEKWIAYPSSMSCLDPASTTKSQCTGDLGDPVLYKFSGASSYVLVGVISDLSFCGTNYPGAYTRIQPYLSWISSQVKGLTYHS